MRKRFLVALIVAGALPAGFGSPARAQDTTPASGEPITSLDPATLTYDYLVDGSLADDEPAKRRFKSLPAAYAAVPAGTADRPTVIGIAPNVYLLPGATLNITKSYITLLGLTNNRRSVVLADNRGNAQGASDNGYVIVVNATGFTAMNLTILNFCNVDYEYPGDPSKNLSKRSAVITQAVALQASGDKHVYENVALLSRLDTMFLQTTRSYFKNVFIEGTDDFIGGGTVSVWEDSEIFFPTGSGVMSAGNIAFINAKFTSSGGLQFSKSAGPGVALINCVMTAPGIGVAWVRGNAPPRPSQNYLTYRVKDGAGNPAVIADGSGGPATFDYSWELSDQQALAFNPWNLLRATPTGIADDWDPAGARATYEAAGQGSLIYKIILSGTPASVRTGGARATIGATVAPVRAPDQSITWSTPSTAISLSRTTGPDVVVTGNTTGAPEYVQVIATAANGFHATAWVYVEPAYVDPPMLASGPTLGPPADGKIAVDYSTDLAGYEDQSVITWSICGDAACASPRDVAVSRDGLPLASYTLTPGDVGNFVRVSVQPKHNVSEPGPAVFAISDRVIAACDLGSFTVSPNFRNFVTTQNQSYVSGLWTVLGTWTVEAGATLVNGYGVRAGSQGAHAAVSRGCAARRHADRADDDTGEDVGRGLREPRFVGGRQQPEVGHLHQIRSPHEDRLLAALLAHHAVRRGVHVPAVPDRQRRGLAAQRHAGSVRRLPTRHRAGDEGRRRPPHRRGAQRHERGDAGARSHHHAQRLRRRRRGLVRHGAARQQQRLQPVRESVYPGVAPEMCVGNPVPPLHPTNAASLRGGGCGCATADGPGSRHALLGALLLLGSLAARRRARSRCKRRGGQHLP